MTTSLFWKNIAFAILQPGIVAVLVPFLIAGNRIKDIALSDFTFYHYSGMLLFLVGLIILVLCISRFGNEGKGTLSPAAPTRQLVISGLYKYSRNPMYVGVSAMLFGEFIFFQSVGLLIYFIVIVIVFNIFIRYREEPRLKHDFGESYIQYCKKVRRWF